MRWACLFFPHLAVDGVLRQRPPTARAVALVTGPAHRRVIHAVNDEASACGIRCGISVQAAQALTHDFIAVEFDAQTEASDLQLLAAWAYTFSSQVTTQFFNAVVLEVGQSMMLFGPWPAFERRLRHELDALGFRHRIACAPNAWAAHALATAHDGIGVDDGRLMAALASLPVALAGFDADSAQSFERMGLRRLGQVFTLPRDTITRRFPAAVLDRLDALRGRPLPLPFYQPSQIFDRRMEFDHEIELSTRLLFPLRRLLSDLAAFVGARDGGVQHFQILFEHDRHPATRLDIGLLAPERDAARLLDITRNRLERATLAAAVRAARVRAEDLPSFVPPSTDLFEQRAQGALTFDQLRERLRARVGSSSVHGLATNLDHRPEFAWRPQRDDKEPHQALSELRPGWLLEHPIVLRGRAEILYGPERIESGWDDGEDARRDYYIVETESGQIAWVFAPVGEIGSFMLHGYFA